jgi:aspartate aminotransferase
MPEFPAHLAQLTGSGIRAIMELAWRRGPDVIGLHSGDPQFPVPAHILEAIAEAQRVGRTGYAPSAGLPELRAALAEKLRRDNGMVVAPERVVVTAGATQALHLALATVLQPGDEVLVPDPGWPNAASMVRVHSGRPRAYPLRPTHGFQPDFGELARLTTQRTRAMLVNSPSNPTGAMFDAAVVSQLVAFAREYDLWLISDECYEACAFDAAHLGAGRFDPDERVITCSSFSKTHAMTGLRVGFLALPETLAPLAVRVQEATMACVNTPVQHGAMAALAGTQEHVTNARASYRRRRDAALALLETAGIAHARPAGAFYLWLRIPSVDSTAWATSLLEARGVAVAPGAAFGARGEGWIRLALVVRTREVVEGLRRVLEHAAQTGDGGTPGGVGG